MSAYFLVVLTKMSQCSKEILEVIAEGLHPARTLLELGTNKNSADYGFLAETVLAMAFTLLARLVIQRVFFGY